MHYTRTVNIILVYPGTCHDLCPEACSNTMVLEEKEFPDPDDIVKRTASAVKYVKQIEKSCSKCSENLMFIFPWFPELRDQLVNHKYSFLTILPKTSKSQDWFMRLVDIGYGFNEAVNALHNFNETIHYKADSSYEHVYRLAPSTDLDFKDISALASGGRMRILSLRILLRDMLPYPELMTYWFFVSIGFLIGFADFREAIPFCCTTLAYTFGANYIIKSYIVRRRSKRNEKF